MRNIQFDLYDDTLVANLSGEVDHHNAGKLRSEIDSAMMAFYTKNLVLDYSKVSFMDSSGIGLAMGRYNVVKRLNGTMVIIPGSQYISRILGLAGIFGQVPKSRSVKLAVEYISENGGARRDN